MFKRKLSRRSYAKKLATDTHSTFASINVPVSVLDKWTNVTDVLLCFDPELSVLLITPAEAQHD